MSQEPYRPLQQTAHRPRARRRRPLPADWPVLLVLAISRAVVAAGFVFVPAFRPRLGDATLTVITIGLALGVAAAAGGVWHVLRTPVRRDLLADVVTLTCLVPTIVVASGIQLADARFGGRAENVLAAMGAVAAVFAIVAFTGASEGGTRFGFVALAALPAALSVAAIIGGTTVFAGGQTWQGLSLAWMAAAGASLVYLVAPGARGWVSILVFTGFAAAMLTLPDRRVTESSRADLDVALLTVAAVAAIVVVIGLAPSGRAGDPTGER